jgi:hypothetical protein
MMVEKRKKKGVVCDRKKITDLVVLLSLEQK